MKYTIHKGKHRAWPLHLGLWFRKKIISKKVVFDFSCKYDLGNADQEDHNKLFGIGYFPSHHTDSARIGWRYDNEAQKIVLSAYCYVNGQRIMKDICKVVCSKAYLMTIEIIEDWYAFNIMSFETKESIGGINVPFWHKKKWSFPLGFFFGGNEPAPLNMSVKMSNYKIEG